MILDVEQREMAAAAAASTFNEVRNLNPDRALLIASAKAAKAEVRNGKVARNSDIPLCRALGLEDADIIEGRTSHTSTSVRADLRWRSDAAEKFWQSPISEERRQRMRERSYSPGLHRKGGGDYRCETDRSPSQYRERRYRGKEHRLGVGGEERRGDFFESSYNARDTFLKRMGSGDARQDRSEKIWI